jgi:hypothetical protein
MRWSLEMRRGLFVRKQPAAAPPAKVRCVAAFNAQSGKAIFRETLIQRTGSLGDDRAAGNGGRGSRRRQSRSTTSSRANGAARVAEELAWNVTVPPPKASPVDRRAGKTRTDYLCPAVLSESRARCDSKVLKNESQSPVKIRNHRELKMGSQLPGYELGYTR